MNKNYVMYHLFISNAYTVVVHEYGFHTLRESKKTFSLFGSDTFVNISHNNNEGLYYEDNITVFTNVQAFFVNNSFTCFLVFQNLTCCE